MTTDDSDAQGISYAEDHDKPGTHDQSSVERKDSAITTQTTSNAASVAETPAGARRTAWLQALGAFLLFYNSWGMSVAFGAFQTYYEQDLLKGHSSSSISWIGTVSAALLIVGGATSGKAYDLGYARTMLVLGSFLVVFGLMMTSLATRYYEVFFAQGVAVGIGTSLLWIPAMTVVATVFQGRMRPIMMGLVTAGSSVGGVVYPIMFRCLQPRVGFSWTVRSMAFLELGTLLVALAALLPFTPKKSPKARRILDRTAIRDVPYMVFTTSGFFTLLAYNAPLIYLPTFVQTSIHHLSRSDLGFYALAVANGSSAVSRITGGFVAAKFGPLVTYTVALFCSAVLLLAWIVIHSIAGLMVWAVLWGLSTGLIISLPGAIIPQLCPHLDLLGTRMGMTFLGGSIGVLIGGPIAGKLIFSVTNSHPTWWPLQTFTGLAMLIGGILNIYVSFHIRAKQ